MIGYGKEIRDITGTKIFDIIRNKVERRSPEYEIIRNEFPWRFLRLCISSTDRRKVAYESPNSFKKSTWVIRNESPWRFLTPGIANTDRRKVSHDSPGASGNLPEI